MTVASLAAAKSFINFDVVRRNRILRSRRRLLIFSRSANIASCIINVASADLRQMDSIANLKVSHRNTY